MNHPSIRPCREAARRSAATPTPFIRGGAAPFIRRVAALVIAAAAAAAAADPATNETAALVAEADRLCVYAPVDFARADELLRRAEAAGSADAIAVRGFMARNGEGVPYDPARARELFREAAARGSVRGRIQHAVECLDGPEADAACKELVSIADSDDPYAWLACDKLARHYERRASRSAAAPVNGADNAIAGLYYSKALAKLAPRAKAGDPEARVAYGDLLLFPRTSGEAWEPDAAWARAENARQWLLPEAEKGNLTAMSMVVDSLDTNFFPRPYFLPNDPAAAASNAAERVRWRDRLVEGLRHAVDQGGVDQTLWLADKLLGGLLDDYGDTSDTDPVGAAALLRRAADAGHPYATILLARCLERGVGVPRDLAAAQARYRAVLAADPRDAASDRAQAAERLARLLLHEGPAGEPEAKRLLKLAHKDPYRSGGVAGRALRAWKDNGPADALRILDSFYPTDPVAP